jgi:hypothetical protein
MEPRQAPDGVDRRRFFFIHVMKTAGTSFAFHIRRTFREAQIYPNRHDLRHEGDVEPYTSIAQLRNLPKQRREQVSLYMGHFPYVACELVGVECVPLTILREPFARTVSVLSHFRHLPKHQGKSLEEIYDDSDVFRLWIDNHQTKIFSITPGDEPRALARPIVIDAERLRDAKANLAKVSAIGFTDRYEVFIEELRGRFGWWPMGVDLRARANVSDEEPHVSSGLRRRIVADNVSDFEFYEFATELVANRGH